MSIKIIPKAIKKVAWVWTGTFWLICVAIPLGSVLSMGLVTGEGSKTRWEGLFDPVVLGVTATTLWQAFWSTLIAGSIGLILGLGLGSLGQRAEKIRFRMQSLLAVPNGVPTVVVAMAWTTWLGRTGILSRLGFSADWSYSLKAVILAHVFLNIPWVALLVSQSRNDISARQLEAASTLGAYRFSQFRWIVWPQVRLAWLSACAQVMVFCVMSFALVLILGGGPPVQTLETELYQRLRYGWVDFRGASVCAIWELGLTLIPWIIVLVLQSQKRKIDLESSNVHLNSEVNPKFNGSGKVNKKVHLWKIIILGIILSGIWIVPYLVVLKAEILKWIVDPVWRSRIVVPLKISFSLAMWSSLSTVLTVLAAILALQTLEANSNKNLKIIKSVVNLLLALPAGVSVLVLGLGFWLAYGQWIDPFEGSFSAMVILQMTLFFPLAFRLLWGVAQKAQTHQLEAALSLGASPFRAFHWVEWKRWKGPLFASLAAVAGASLGEMGAVSLFYSEKLIPLPLLVYRLMARYRFEEAQAVAGLLFLLSFLLILGSFEISHRFEKIYDSSKLPM